MLRQIDSWTNYENDNSVKCCWIGGQDYYQYLSQGVARVYIRSKDEGLFMLYDALELAGNEEVFYKMSISSLNSED